MSAQTLGVPAPFPGQIDQELDQLPLPQSNPKETAPTSKASESAEVQRIVEQKKQRFQKIRQQVDQLSKAWQRRQQEVASPEQTSQPTGQPGEVESGTVESPRIVNPQVPPPVSPGVPIPELPQADVAPAFPNTSPDVPVIAPNDSTPPVTSELVESTPSPDTQSEANEPIGPIDRFALASSLYATGHFVQCLQVLESLEESELLLYELEWAKFLRAGCLRHTGELGEAQRIYRQLVADDQTDWIAETSRWWLTHLGEQTENRQGLTELKTALEQWEVEVNDLISKQN